MQYNFHAGHHDALRESSNPSNPWQTLTWWSYFRKGPLLAVYCVTGIWVKSERIMLLSHLVVAILKFLGRKKKGFLAREIAKSSLFSKGLMGQVCKVHEVHLALGLLILTAACATSIRPQLRVNTHSCPNWAKWKAVWFCQYSGDIMDCSQRLCQN